MKISLAYLVPLVYNGDTMKVLEKIQKGNVTGYLMLKQRIVVQGGIYHVTQRASGKENLFLEDEDYLYFLKVLKESVKKFELDLFSYCLMPNHIHLLFRLNQENLSVAMKNVFERYADYVNKKHDRRGHVFCGRYRASFCNGETYLLAASAYIHLNPYRAGLCDAQLDYRWSSAGLYINRWQESFVDAEFILKMLSENPARSVELYREFIMDGIKQDVVSHQNRRTEARFAIHEAARLSRKVLGRGGKAIDKELDQRLDEFSTLKKVMNPEDKKERVELISKMLDLGYRPWDIRKQLCISKTTYYRISKEI